MAGRVDIVSAVYRDAARGLCRTLTRQLMSALIDIGAVIVADDGAISDEDLNTVYKFAFPVCVALEDMGGFVSHGERWFAAVLLSKALPQGSATDVYLGSTERTALHGQLDDDLIREAAVEFASQP